jgi:hypothetical protein
VRGEKRPNLHFYVEAGLPKDQKGKSGFFVPVWGMRIYVRTNVSVDIFPALKDGVLQRKLIICYNKSNDIPE